MSSLDELRLGEYGRELMSSVDDRSGPSSRKNGNLELKTRADWDSKQGFPHRCLVGVLEVASYTAALMVPAHSCVVDTLGDAAAGGSYC